MSANQGKSGRGLLVCGTGSDAGKSVIAAGLCRWLAREGVRVAPYKAQNMSNNSAVTADGAEIGRAQVAQAAACGVEPTAEMNPVLLKPGPGANAHVVVLGKPAEVTSPAGFQALKPRLRSTAIEALDTLRRRFDVVICEGAGSPAEINLRENDLANLGIARAADLPVLLVGDIDRGGVFASLAGTLAVLDPADQRHIVAFLINKFRGDASLLDQGLEDLRALTGRPFLGVVPWVPGLTLDAEDSLEPLAGRDTLPPLGRDTLDVSVVRLRWISNFTDVDPLMEEPGVRVRFTRSAADIAAADLVVIPGTRATVADLDLLRDEGLDRAVAARAKRGDPILGICGGYQMLGGRITDGVEGPRDAEGMGLLAVAVRFEREKLQRRVSGTSPLLGDAPASGYEIRHGRIDSRGTEALLRHADGGEEGAVEGGVLGTSWHGLLENDVLRTRLLTWVTERRGLDWRPQGVAFGEARERQLDALADLIEAHVDTSALRRLIDSPPKDLPTLALKRA